MQIMALKSSHDGKLSDYQSPTAVYVVGKKPWEIDTKIDMAYPCATQVRPG
jgi:hypothetical protein